MSHVTLKKPVLFSRIHKKVSATAYPAAGYTILILVLAQSALLGHLKMRTANGTCTSVARVLDMLMMIDVLRPLVHMVG